MTSGFFKNIFDNARAGMVILGKDARILFSNNTFCTMTGLDLSQLMNISLYQLISPDYTTLLEQGIEQLQPNPPDHEVLTVRKMDPETDVWWQITVQILFDEETGKKFLFAMIIDTTEQVVGQKRLESARDAAEKSTRDKSSFLANMSHEIRTPIHTVIGMNELLLETTLDPEQQEYAEQIRFSADVLLGLINDILDFSKIEAGKLDLEMIRFNLHQMVEEALDMVSLEAHKKGIEVITDIRPGVPAMVIGDPVRVRQIILNLYNNAVKFTQQGEISVALQLEHEEEDWVMCRFFVRDTGIGIPKEKLSKLFRAFTQIDHSTTRKYGGTGLGLSISQNLVRMMQGKIGVESEAGEGSTFWFTVKLGKVADSPEPYPERDEMSGIKVLVVDDNNYSREVLSSYLREWGMSVFKAESGDAALQILRESAEMGDPVRVCIVDLLMPGMDGWQFASEVNADKNINLTKMILLSPSGKSGEEAKMKLLHWFDVYLNKPVKKQKIYDTLCTILSDDSDLESVEDAADLEEIGELESVDAAGGGREMQKARILIAEDHEVNQQLFKAILENLGHDVDVASNGRIAVEKAEHNDFDLIFMDVQMPEMNGYEATQKLCSLKIKAPIIAATASAIKEEQDRCSEAGMVDLLIKPFKKADVVKLLGKWLIEREDPAPEQNGGQAVPPAQEEQEGNNSDIFNFDEAVETFMGKKEVVLNVLSQFIDKVEGQIPVISEALDTGDLGTVRGEAHSIKGGGLSLEVIRLGNKAKELEDAAREERAEDAAAVFEELQDEFRTFLDYVQPLREG